MGLAFDRAGSGPPLVLIHGLGHRRQGWTAVLDLLTPHRDVIMVDLPGHGESPPLEADGRRPVAIMAEQVAALLSELRLSEPGPFAAGPSRSRPSGAGPSGPRSSQPRPSGAGIERPHVAGNSLGGTVALALAVLGRAASVTALSPAGFPAHDYEVGYAKAVFGAARNAGRAIMPLVPAMSRSAAGRAVLYGAMVTRPGRITAEQARGDVAGFVACRAAMRAVFGADERFTASVPDDVPVTIAWGSKDRVLPLSNARVARQRLPRARFVPLPGCGHVPMTDDPDLVAKVLLAGSEA